MSATNGDQGSYLPHDGFAEDSAEPDSYAESDDLVEPGEFAEPGEMDDLGGLADDEEDEEDQ
jgi:hypothetical protein